MKPQNTRYVAVFELFLATAIWGFGFTATVWALSSVDAVSMTVIRFSVSFVIGLLILRWAGLKEEINKKNFLLAAAPGLLLGLMILLQSWGLQYTSVTNSGFITTLYVVLVPLFDSLMLKQRVTRIHFVWVLLALLGTALMVNVAQMTALNKGDLLTLVTAILAALQIVWIGRVRSQITSSFAFNTFQSLWAFLGATLFWPVYGQIYFHPLTGRTLLGLISLTLGSTLLGFALQVKAQKQLSSSTASVLFLLESPFAAIFGLWLLDEKMTGYQLLGGVLIFIAALGTAKTE